jgi:hypothetical protein
MNDRFYLAVLAGGALVLSGLAGCDAGEQREPGSPEPDSTAMYGAEETDETETETAREMQREPTQPMDQTTDPAQDTYATGGRQDSTVAGLESMSDQEVVGMTVISREGEEIGTIEEVATESGGAMGQDKLAVVDVGGFLGIGEKSIAIPFSDLELSQDGRLQSDLTREALQSQPEYQGGETGERPQPEQTGEL